MGSVKYFACVVVMCMALVGAPMVQAITCGQVAAALAPCIGYLQKGGAPPVPCCGGVRNLVAVAKTPGDRKTACSCLKQAAGSIAGYNDANAVSLPGKCGVNIPYKISTSTNCATIN